MLKEIIDAVLKWAKLQGTTAIIFTLLGAGVVYVWQDSTSGDSGLAERITTMEDALEAQIAALDPQIDALEIEILRTDTRRQTLYTQVDGHLNGYARMLGEVDELAKAIIDLRIQAERFQVLFENLPEGGLGEPGPAGPLGEQGPAGQQGEPGLAGQDLLLAFGIYDNGSNIGQQMSWQAEGVSVLVVKVADGHFEIQFDPPRSRPPIVLVNSITPEISSAWVSSLTARAVTIRTVTGADGDNYVDHPFHFVILRADLLEVAP